MKNFIIMGILLFTLFSCTNNETIDDIQTEVFDVPEVTKDAIINAPLSQQMEYKRYHMEVLASWIGKNSEEIRTMASSQKTSKTGEAQIFLIEDLVFNLIERKGTNKGSDTDENLEKVKNSLNAFKELGGESWYPTVFQKSDLSSESRSTNKLG